MKIKIDKYESKGKKEEVNWRTMRVNNPLTQKEIENFLTEKRKSSSTKYSLSHVNNPYSSKAKNMKNYKSPLEVTAAPKLQQSFIENSNK